ncbi:MAG: hypothetical protein AAF485_32785, partial [Chloroflexota bacterium]
MSIKVTVLHFINGPTDPEIVTLLGKAIEITHVNCHGDLDQLIKHVSEINEQGEVEAIALDGVAQTLRLGNRSVAHEQVVELFAAEHKIPILDGSELLPAIERWSIRLAHTNEPGIWAHKRVLMAPRLNHSGLADALGHHAATLQAADHLLYTPSPQKDDRALLDHLKSSSFESIFSLNQPPLYSSIS